MGLMKRAICILILFTAVFSLGVSADQFEAVDPAVKVYDGAYLFSENEKNALNEKAAKIAQREQMDVVILTTESTGTQTARAYGEAFYLNHGFGLGSERSGVMLVIDMHYNIAGSRRIELIAFGDACERLTLRRIDRILDSNQMMEPLRSGRYAEACSFVVQESDRYISSAFYRTKEYIPIFFFISFLAAAIFFLAAYLCSKNTNQRHFCGYTDPGALTLVKQRNEYVRTSVIRTPISESSSSTGRTSGGTGSGSVRSHSSGRNF